MLKIEKNIAIPIRQVRRSLYPFKEMKVGDSFFVECSNTGECYKTTSNVLACFRNFKAYHPECKDWKVTTRKNEKGIRCWRFQ